MTDVADEGTGELLLAPPLHVLAVLKRRAHTLDAASERSVAYRDPRVGGPEYEDGAAVWLRLVSSFARATGLGARF